MQKALARVSAELRRVLGDGIHLYLYGSVPMGDFRYGWSDIDILCLADTEVTEEQAQSLVGLRQALLEREPGNPYYRSFEGAVLSVGELRSGKTKRAVYYGTSGQRITDRYTLDVFSLWELRHAGNLLYGTDILPSLPSPDAQALRNGVRLHYESIRQYAQATGESLYSCGWLLDIARCLYTLRYHTVLSKTAAGEWALAENLCPEPEQLRHALKIRKSPWRYRDLPEEKAWLSLLAPTVQRFADVLERELEVK